MSKENQECQHNALRRVRENRHTFTAYVCGNCAELFEVEKYVAPLRHKAKPLGQKIPWGLRDRQA